MILRVRRCSCSDPGVAAAAPRPGLPWEAALSPGCSGAGEDGRDFRSGLSRHSFLCMTNTHTHTVTLLCVFQLYSLFLTAAAGHLTGAESHAAAGWAAAMHAGMTAVRRCKMSLASTSVSETQQNAMMLIHCFFFFSRYGGADAGDRTMVTRLCCSFQMEL